jgi:predicted transcriptional regulator of viral defense system
MCEGRLYFLSHASAMELHRMVTQPQFTIYVSSTMRTPPRSVHGHEYRFVTVKPMDFFGLMQVWVTKQQSVMVSDKERTIFRSFSITCSTFRAVLCGGGSASCWNSTQWPHQCSSNRCV